jgi:ribosome-binding factor A
VSFLANKEPADVCLEKIKGRAKQIRMHLGSKIHLRVVPELDFYFDDTIEYASRIDELIKEIHKDDDKSGDSTSDQ